MNVLINITYHGQSGNYLVNMDPGVDDATIKNICEEAVRSGEVPGVSPAIPKNAFANFVIDRFHGDQPRFRARVAPPSGGRRGARRRPHRDPGSRRTGTLRVEVRPGQRGDRLVRTVRQPDDGRLHGAVQPHDLFDF